MGQFHVPVLLKSVCTLLKVEPGGRYIDATLGGGGHAAAIIAEGGEVLGLDQDSDALLACPDLNHLVKVHANFIHLKEEALARKWTSVSGVVFDLGVSSHQISTAHRGFSFQLEGPLDMRMDRRVPVTAADLVNCLSEKDLTHIISLFGEVKGAAGVSRRIIHARPISTTKALASLFGNPHIRRQVFQALRMAVNDELGALETALPQALSLLIPGGRIVVISFHSLEDRLVKSQFSDWASQGLGEILTPKPVVPDQKEKTTNPKSISAKLRSFQKSYV
jgi:16S rRNA (cytosine1402-N4)-methyltransferase